MRLNDDQARWLHYLLIAELCRCECEEGQEEIEFCNAVLRKWDEGRGATPEDMTSGTPQP